VGGSWSRNMARTVGGIERRDATGINL